MTGWGWTEQVLARSYPAILQQVIIPVVSNKLCAVQLSRMRDSKPLGVYVRPTNICAGYPKGGKSVCSGDSGGPAVWLDSGNRAYQLGVVSWGVGCALPNYPAVYTRVTEYLGWIQANTGKYY